MQAGQLRSSVASVLAFGHMMGLRHGARHHKPRGVAKHIEIREPSMTARDMGIRFEDDPALYRAFHPVFSGRSQSEDNCTQAENAEQVEPECGLSDSRPTELEMARNRPDLTVFDQPVHSVCKAATWTWEI